MARLGREQQAWYVGDRHGVAGTVMAGKAALGSARIGKDRQGLAGKARTGKDRRGKAGEATRGWARRGADWKSRERQAW